MRVVKSNRRDFQAAIALLSDQTSKGKQYRALVTRYPYRLNRDWNLTDSEVVSLIKVGVDAGKYKVYRGSFCCCCA